MTYPKGKTNEPEKDSVSAAEYSPRWARRAWLLALSAFVAVNLAYLSFFPYFPEDQVAALWLGLLPIHGGPLLAVLGALHYWVPRGGRSSVLGLSATGFRLMVRHWPRYLSLMLVIYAGAMVLNMVSVAISVSLGHQPSPHPLVPALLENPSPALYVSVFAAAVLIAPASEEILFRVVLFDSVRSLGWWSAAILASFVFAAVHANPVHFPSLFFLGMCLQWLRTRSGSLWPCVLGHAVFNLIVFVVLILWSG